MHRPASCASRLPPPEQLEASAMPSDDGVRLDDEKGGTPVCPDLRHDRPEDPITLPHAWSLGLSSKSGDLLTKREILQGEFRPVAENRGDKQQETANRTHFTASTRLYYRLKTIAEASRASNRKSCIDKEYGIFVRDTQTAQGGDADSCGRMVPGG